MPRIARVVAPEVPHHITQRGDRRQVTFFCDDVLVKAKPLLAEFGDWETFLDNAPCEEELGLFRRHDRTGRPLGSGSSLSAPEQKLGRVPRPQKPGPKLKGKKRWV